MPLIPFEKAYTLLDTCRGIHCPELPCLRLVTVDGDEDVFAYLEGDEEGVGHHTYEFLKSEHLHVPIEGFRMHLKPVPTKFNPKPQSFEIELLFPRCLVPQYMAVHTVREVGEYRVAGVCRERQPLCAPPLIVSHDQQKVLQTALDNGYSEPWLLEVPHHE